MVTLLLPTSGPTVALQPRDIETAEQIISQADICLIHGRLPQETIIKAIQCAALHNVRVILNPARPIGSASARSADLPIEYFGVDTLIANLYEAADITEHSTANIHAAKLIGSDLVARGVHCVVITMGRRGCVVVDRSSADHIPAFGIELLDHTCTGDAFAGALAASLATKTELRQAAIFASAAGALACTKFGSIESLPAKTEIIELLQKQEDKTDLA